MLEATAATKYFSLKKELIKKIDAHEYREGESIPSERELVETYGVSRITVRRAIDELVHEGYLFRSQGRGTYVKSKLCPQNLFSITSCTQDVINLGMTPRREVVSAQVVPASEKLCGLLELNPGEDVFRLERVYYADSTPINYTVTNLPYRLFFGIDLFDFSQESLYQVLEKDYQTRLTKATRSLDAALAKGEIADLLEVRHGTPLLFFSCVTEAEVRGKSHPIEYFDCWYRSDKFKFYINQVAT